MSEPKLDPEKLIQFKADDIIFLENEASNGLYVLVEGEIDVLKKGKIVGRISDKGAIFGEMSYLANHKRQATLRARTDVKSYKLINQGDSKHLVRSCPEIVLRLLKNLATRLDISNLEVMELERYRQFRDHCIENAEKTNNEELKTLYKQIDETIKISDQEKNYHIVMEYLHTPRIWGQFKNICVDIIEHYIGETLQVVTIDEYTENEIMYGVSSWLSYHGERTGGICIDISHEMAKSLANSFGFEKVDLDVEKGTVQEITNQILGNMIGKVEALNVKLSTPEGLTNSQDLWKKLDYQPSIKIEFKSSYGPVKMVFRMDPEK